jgi:hypothetical protein
MSPNDEVFVCSCRDEIKSKDDVDKHEVQEYWSKRHGKQCQFPGCKDTIRQTSNAKRHWRTHLPERLGHYFCTRCGIGYAKPEALKKHEAAVDCRKNRKRCRSELEEDPATAIPPITPRNDMSPSDGHAADLRTTSGVPPSTGTSPPSTTSTPSLNEEAAEKQKARLEEQQQQAQVAARPAGPLSLYDSLDDWNLLRWLPQYISSPSALVASSNGELHDGLSENELATHPASDEWRNNTSSLRSTRERRTGSPTPAPLDKRGFHHIQRPNDTRASTETYTCTYHGCTQRFESQPALQRHERDSNRSQEHNDNDSGAESGTASVSPRPHTRAVLIPGDTNGPYAQPPKHHFIIGRSPEFQLGDFRMRYAGRVLPKFHVVVAGFWVSVGILLSDLTENVRFEHHRPGPSSTRLWGVIAKATPPALLRAMVYRHLYFVDGHVSQWAVDSEWTEEGISGHWQEFGTALKLSEGTAKSITVCAI